MLLLQGTSNPNLSAALSQALGAAPVRTEIKRFPDQELYCRLLGPVKGEDVVLVQSTYPDHNAMEFLLLSQLLRDSGARSVIGVVPYYGYARQDKVFREGESYSARTMAKHLELSIDSIVCVNLHKEATLKEFTRAGAAVNVSVMPEVGVFLKTLDTDLILSPDKGAIGYAKEASEAAGCPFDHLEKTRIDGSTVSMAKKDLDVDGKKVAIVDDIIATGGTILKAREALMAQGASAVVACCAHGLYTGGGRERLSAVLDGLYSSDTIENPTAKISAARPIAEAITGLAR